MQKSYDAVVVGGGPGGYVCAIRLSQNGLKTLLIEKEHLGGVCLNWGCIPSKLFLKVSHEISSLEKLGVKISKEEKNHIFLSLLKKRKELSSSFQKGIEYLFKKYQVDYLVGEAFYEGGKVFYRNEKEEKELSSSYFLFATGGKPREIKKFPFSSRVLHYRDIFSWGELPSSLLIIGGGVIGVEYADFLSSLGVKITLIEKEKHILPWEEERIASIIKKSLQKKGVEVYEGVEISSLEEENGVKVKWKDKEEKFSYALVAAGIEPAPERVGLSLEAFPKEGFLYQKDSKVYIFGDLLGRKPLAHTASKEGIYLADLLAGKDPSSISYSWIPVCIYTSPQLARVGYFKEELEEKGIPYKEICFPNMASSMAKVYEDKEGINCVYVEKNTGEILGGVFLQEKASELISYISLGHYAELTPYEYLLPFPHPTYSEIIGEIMQGYTSSMIHY